MSYLNELLNSPNIKKWKNRFSPLDLKEKHRKNPSVEVLQNGLRIDLIELLYNLIRENNKSACRILILGPPGSGKTAATQYLSLKIAEEGVSNCDLPIPLIIDLGDFQEGDIQSYIAYSFKRVTTKRCVEIFQRDLNNLLEKGRLFLIFDALDEALGEQREIVLAELSKFFENKSYKNVPVIITARTKEDPGERLKDLQIFEIQDLNNEAVEFFIEAYNESDIRNSEIFNKLKNHHFLDPGGIGRNPFWLEILIVSGVLEGNEGKILNDSINFILDREYDKPRGNRFWKKKEFNRDNQRKYARTVFSYIAYKMSQLNRVVINTNYTKQFLNEWIKLNFPQNLIFEDIITQGKDSKILDYTIEDKIKFRHRLLQEFFTACYLVENPEFIDIIIPGSKNENGWLKSWGPTLLLFGNLAKEQDLNNLIYNLLQESENRSRLFIAAGLILIQKTGDIELYKIISSGLVPVIKNEPINELISEIDVIRVMAGEDIAIFFRDSIRSNEPEIKRKAIQLLTSMGTKTSIKVLFESLVSDDADLISTLISLDKFGIDLIITLIKDEDSITRLLAEKTLVTTGDPSVERLIAKIRNGNVRIQAIDALGRIGDPKSVEPLIAQLNDENAYVRIRVIDALGRIGDPKSVEPLIAQLNDENGYVRIRVIDALGRIGDPKSVEPLIAQLKDENARGQVIDALGRIGDPKAIEPLIAQLEDENVRRPVIDALVRIGAPAVEPLIAQLKDENARGQVIDALGRIGDPNVIGLLIAQLKDENVRRQVIDALVRIGAPAVEPLIAQLKDENVREHVIGVLCRFDRSKVVEPLIAQLKDENVREQIIDALGRIGDPKSIDPLIAQLKDETVREQVIGVLCRFDSPKVVDPLIAQLKDENVREQIIDALVRISAPAVEPLIAQLKDENVCVRIQVINALGRIGAPAVESLIAQLKDEEVRVLIIGVLGRIGGPKVIEPLIAALNDENEYVRKIVIKDLGRIGDPRSIKPLIAQLKDENVRTLVIDALVRIGAPAVEPLLTALKDEDCNVREQIMYVLKKIQK